MNSCDACGQDTTRGRNGNGRFCNPCATTRKAASKREVCHRRRARGGLCDMTPAIQTAMRTAASECPLCACPMTDEWGTPTSKELDHIVPLNAGGTHTRANVRIICRSCNLRRPQDGRDYAGAVTFDMIDLEFAEAVAMTSRRRVRAARGLSVGFTSAPDSVIAYTVPLDQHPPMMTPAQAAGVLRAAESVLARWRRNGEGPTYIQVTPGGSGMVRYPRERLRTWLADAPLPGAMRSAAETAS